MNNFAFYSPTEFVFGKGTESQIAELVKKYKGTKVMIVYGGGSVVRSGLLDKVKKYLDEAGIAHVELGGIQPNPTDPKVYEGIELGRREGIDFLLPVGGGSVIDTAKAIAMGIPYEGDFWDFYMNKVVPEKAIPLGVVLTIPAAGSEGSGNTVITKLDGLKKLSVRTHGLLRPTFAVMNPELTYTLPAWQTACGVTDMMAHIMERYFTNTEDQEVPDRMCEGTLKAIITEASGDEGAGKLRSSCQPDVGRYHRTQRTCGVGAVEDWASHFMEHEVSAVYDVTHGAGLAVIFPAWLTYMASHNVGKVAQYAHRVWDVPESDDKKAMALEGVTRLKSFFHAIGMPVTFKELGIEHPDIDLLVKKLHENKGEYVGNYVRLNAQATREIYELANQ